MLPTENLPKIICVGRKILSIIFRNIKFIDSLSFLPMPLSAFTKTFEIAEFKKGNLNVNFLHI